MGDFGSYSGDGDFQFLFSKPVWYAWMQRLNVWDQKVQPLGEVKNCDAADTTLWNKDERLKAKVTQCTRGNTFHT